LDYLLPIYSIHHVKFYFLVTSANFALRDVKNMESKNKQRSLFSLLSFPLAQCLLFQILLPSCALIFFLYDRLKLRDLTSPFDMRLFFVFLPFITFTYSRCCSYLATLQQLSSNKPHPTSTPTPLSDVWSIMLPWFWTCINIRLKTWTHCLFFFIGAMDKTNKHVTSPSNRKKPAMKYLK